MPTSRGAVHVSQGCSLGLPQRAAWVLGVTVSIGLSRGSWAADGSHTTPMMSTPLAGGRALGTWLLPACLPWGRLHHSCLMQAGPCPQSPPLPAACVLPTTCSWREAPASVRCIPEFPRAAATAKGAKALVLRGGPEWALTLGRGAGWGAGGGGQLSTVPPAGVVVKLGLALRGRGVTSTVTVEKWPEAPDAWGSAPGSPDSLHPLAA